jgi:PqqD family protein of HPr-rel-A system
VSLHPGRYRAVEGIRSFDFGDECMIFNPLSWDTHILNAAAAAILEAVAEAPQSVAEIEEYLQDLLVESQKGEAPAHTRRLIDELVQLGLIRQLASDVGAHL